MAIWLLPAAHVLTTADRSMFVGAAPLIAHSYDLTNAQIGVLLGPAVAFSYAFGAIAFGALADRGRARSLLLGGVCAMIVAAVMQAGAGGYSLLLAGRVCAGLAQAAVAPVALFLIVSHPVVRDRPHGIARFTAGSALGRSGGLLFAGLVLAGLASAGVVLSGTGLDAGWRIALLSMIVPMLLFLAAVARWIAAPAAAPAAAKARDLAGSVRLLPYFLAAIGPALLAQAVIAWGGPLLDEVLRIGTPASVALFGTILLATAPAAQWAAGRVTGRFAAVRARPFAVNAVALVAVQPLLWLVVRGGAQWVVVVALAGVVVAMGFASFTALHAIGAVSPDGSRGATMGSFIAFATFIGVGGGPWLTGVLSDGSAGDGIGSALRQVGAGVAAFAVLLSAGRAMFVGARR